VLGKKGKEKWGGYSGASDMGKKRERREGNPALESGFSWRERIDSFSLSFPPLKFLRSVLKEATPALQGKRKKSQKREGLVRGGETRGTPSFGKNLEWGKKNGTLKKGVFEPRTLAAARMSRKGAQEEKRAAGSEGVSGGKEGLLELGMSGEGGKRENPGEGRRLTQRISSLPGKISGG